MSEMTLLEKARAKQTTAPTSRRRTPSVEEIELLQAFLRGAVTAHQLAGALGIPLGSSSVNNWVLTNLKLALRAGVLTVTEQRPASPVGAVGSSEKFAG